MSEDYCDPMNPNTLIVHKLHWWSQGMRYVLGITIYVVQSVANIAHGTLSSEDSFPHQALLNKLHNFQVPGTLLLWLINYLSNRHQRVILNGSSLT